MNYFELWTVAIALLSLIVACIALGWNIFRDCIDKPKLKLNMYIADYYDMNTLNEMPQVLSLTVANTGKQSIVIKGHGFRMKNKSKMLFPEVMNLFDRKRLEPYDNLDVTFSHAILENLISKADDIRAFFVFDTTGREWYLPRKTLNELRQSLQAKKASLLSSNTRATKGTDSSL